MGGQKLKRSIMFQVERGGVEGLEVGESPTVKKLSPTFTVTGLGGNEASYNVTQAISYNCVDSDMNRY
jgi:hypothetical protein